MNHSPEKEVLKLFQDFAQAFEKKDLASIRELFAHGEGVQFYGTQSSLHFNHWDSIEASFKKQFSVLENIHCAFEEDSAWIKILEGGNVACVSIPTMTFSATLGELSASFKDTRLTGVVERQQGCFRFVQMHWSVSDTKVQEQIREPNVLN